MTRVLVIDDEDLVRSAFRLALRREGYDIVDCGSGQTAVERFDEYAPDLVIVDLVMPDQDGFETIDQIRQKSPEVPIIAITGGGPMGPDRLIQRVSAMGIELALKKPVDRNDLVLAVNKAISE